MKKWEYMELPTQTGLGFLEETNRLGQEGWEFVCFFVHYSCSNYRLYKRPADAQGAY